MDDASYPVSPGDSRGPRPAGVTAEGPLRRHAVWLLVALAYLSVWPYFERLNNPNENVRVWMTRAIVEHHTLAIERVSAEWGTVDDKAQAGGHLYSSKAPGTSFLGVPVLWLQTRVWHLRGWRAPSKRAATLALRLGSVVPCALAFLFAFARFVERRTRSPAARDLLVVGVGLGTLLYPYGILFVGHAQAAFAGFASFMVLAWPPPADAGAPGSTTAISDGRLAAAGALAGTAVLFEYQLILVAGALAAYAVWRARGRAFWFVVGALPPALALGAYHAALFGRPWAFPYGHLENQTYARLHHGSGFFGLTGPRLAALGTSFFSVSYGLFVFSPFLLVGVAAALRRLARRPRAEAVLFLAVGVALALFLAGMTHWRAGWCVGPRYIAGLVPYLAAGLILDGGGCKEGGRGAEAARALLGGLIVVSVFLNGISAATYPHYPELYDNPVFDLALPLLHDGYVPYGLGWALRLPRTWSLLPVASLWAAALALALSAAGRDSARGGAGRRFEPTPARRLYPSGLLPLARIAGALVVAALVLVPLARYGRGPSVAERHATAIVRSLWEPAPTHFDAPSPR